MQEVDKCDDLLNMMEPHGYKGILKKPKGKNHTNVILYDANRLEVSHPEQHGNYTLGDQKYTLV
jgi:hypothetical protein